MKICPACQCQTVDEVNFCPECGTPLAPLQEMPPTPPYTYAPPMPMQNPKPPALAKSIVGMILSINGLVCAAIGIFFVLYLSAVLGMVTGFALSDGMICDPDFALFSTIFSIYPILFAFIIGAEALPCAIVGRFLGTKAKDEGNQTKMAHFGIKLGMIGIVLTIVMLGLAVIATALMMML